MDLKRRSVNKVWAGRTPSRWSIYVMPLRKKNRGGSPLFDHVCLANWAYQLCNDLLDYRFSLVIPYSVCTYLANVQDARTRECFHKRLQRSTPSCVWFGGYCVLMVTYGFSSCTYLIRSHAVAESVVSGALSRIRSTDIWWDKWL